MNLNSAVRSSIGTYFSTNGRYLSIANGRRDELVICDLEAAKPVARRVEFVPPLSSGTGVSVVAFSKSSQDISVRFETRHIKYPDAGVLLGNLDTLRIDSNVAYLPMPLYPISPSWQNEDRELFVDGASLIDIASNKQILKVVSHQLKNIAAKEAKTWMIGNQLMIEAPRGGVAVTQIPLERIRRSLVAMGDPNTRAYLRPGDAVSIVVEGDVDDSPWKEKAIEWLKKGLRNAGLRVAENSPIVFRMRLSVVKHGVYKLAEEQEPISKHITARNDSERKKLNQLRQKAAQLKEVNESLRIRDFRTLSVEFSMTRTGESSPFWEFRNKSRNGFFAGTADTYHEIIPRDLTIPYYVPGSSELTALPYLVGPQAQPSRSEYERLLVDFSPPPNSVKTMANFPNTQPNIRRNPRATNANPGF